MIILPPNIRIFPVFLAISTTDKPVNRSIQVYAVTQLNVFALRGFIFRDIHEKTRKEFCLKFVLQPAIFCSCRLVLRRHYCLPITICDYLKIPKGEGASRILGHWVCYKVSVVSGYLLAVSRGPPVVSFLLFIC